MQNVPGQKPKVLFVDDDRSLLRLYQDEFSDEGYEVMLASNGDDGLTAFRRESPDVVILDLNMPQRDGIEVLNTMLGLNRQAKIIIHTAHPHFRDNFLTWGAEAYMVKSSDLDDLKKKIKDTLGHGDATLC